jgi:hypothetical protein
MEDEIESLRADRDRLAAEVERLKKTVKFLRYYECSDAAVRSMTDALLKAVEDDTLEADVENLVMNLDQYRRQRDEARDAHRMMSAAYDGKAADCHALERELERWRHGQQIEGDYVCENALQRDLALSSAEALRVECERMRAVVEIAERGWYAPPQPFAGQLDIELHEAIYRVVDARDLSPPTAKGTGDE